MMVLLVLTVCFLAYSNGTNDNFKGVASLFGSRSASYRTAIHWATVTTFSGSITGIFIAQTLLTKFSGKGLVPDQVATSAGFLAAAALSAGATVILATVTGFPVSTTHALTGAIVGSGMVAAKGDVNLESLSSGFLLPLVLSPLFAVALAALVYFLLRLFRLRAGITKERYAYEEEPAQFIPVPEPQSRSFLQMAQPALRLANAMAAATDVRKRHTGELVGFRPQQLIDAAHFISAGAVSFARGLNDTPKITALMVAVAPVSVHWAMLLVAVIIAAGGLLNAKKVAETMSLKITTMNHDQGLAASVTTALLVTVASGYGMPVSTTHVSVGSLFGIGLISGQANIRVVLSIGVSWVLTLPCAAILGAISCSIIRAILPV